jgi:putative SOS response-associated peptidase YedK
MCGRFTFTVDLAELRQSFPWLTAPEHPTARYNIAPTQPVAVVPNTGENRLDYFVWGLIPYWAKDPTIGSRMINARAETLAEKSSFRTPFRRRRCLVLADGFYEWRKEPGSKTKTPYLIHMKSGQPFAFAGLWERWHSPLGDEVLSCTIITTRPNELVAKLHDRMPVILHPSAYEVWLAPAEQPSDKLQGLLEPFPAGEMEAYPVSPLVNSPSNDVPECILPA